MKPIIKIRKDRIDITGAVGIAANVQGETGLMMPSDVIRESIEEYNKLITTAPYYRLMLDSHLEMKTAKWNNVVGIINSVSPAEDGSAIINYSIFSHTKAYNVVSIMVKAGLPGAVSVSTRGFGRSDKVTPGSYGAKRLKIKRRLGNSEIKLWRYIGESIHKNKVTVMNDFILLGWDLVVAPSQVETGLHILNNSPAIVGESCGTIMEKLISEDLSAMQDFASIDIEKVADGQLSPISESGGISVDQATVALNPHLRVGLVDEDGKLGKSFGSIEDILGELNIGR